MMMTMITGKDTVHGVEMEGGVLRLKLHSWNALRSVLRSRDLKVRIHFARDDSCRCALNLVQGKDALRFAHIHVASYSAPDI